MSRHSADAVAFELRDALLSLVGDEVAAIWLYGASVFGHPFVDVDVHVVMKRDLPVTLWERIQTIHREISRSTGVAREDLDWWYISLEAARGTASPKHLGPWTHGLIDEHWALHRAHWLGGRCKVIHGLRPESVVPPPTWAELQDVLMRELRSPEPNAYWSLQLCRVWASLMTRNVVRSKLDSARWALQRLDHEHHLVVREAMKHYERGADAVDLGVIKERFPALLGEVRRRIDALCLGRQEERDRRDGSGD